MRVFASRPYECEPLRKPLVSVAEREEEEEGFLRDERNKRLQETQG